MEWWAVGASLWSSNIGSEHFVGLAGSGAAVGIAMVMYEWMSMVNVLLLGWLFLPVYVSSGVYTMPEYMSKRFGGMRLRIYLSCFSLVLYIVTKLAVAIFAGALFIKIALGLDMYWSIVGLLVITNIYTILGGLTAVIYTDTLQSVIMTIGAFVLLGISFKTIGGYSELEARYINAVAPVGANQSETCGKPRDDAFHVFRDPVNSDNPWPGLLLQSSIGCLWYWCCDQVIVQRSLAAKNLAHAKAGSILAGYLKLTPLFFMVLPGMISRVLYPEVIACADPDKCQEFCENPVGCSNMAYPKLVMELLPTGLRGLLMAVMLSAIMSSLTSIFNSSATLFTMDLWRRLRTHASQRELLIVGRIFVLCLCMVAILWIPLIKSFQGGQLFAYINVVQGYLGTPIGALFIMAVVWKRMTERGAFFGILVGHASGVIRMAIDFAYTVPGCGEEDQRPAILSSVHYTYFGVLNLVVTAISIATFSYLSPAPTEDELQGVTWWTRIGLRTKGHGDTHFHDTDSNKDIFSSNEKETPDHCIEMKTVMGESNDMPNEDNDDDDDEEVEEDDRSRGRWLSLLDSVCGFPTTSGSKERETPEITYQQRLQFLRENPKWQGFLNVNAVIGLLVMTFLVGFFR